MLAEKLFLFETDLQGSYEPGEAGTRISLHMETPCQSTKPTELKAERKGRTDDVCCLNTECNYV